MSESSGRLITEKSDDEKVHMKKEQQNSAYEVRFQRSVQNRLMTMYILSYGMIYHCLTRFLYSVYKISGRNKG